MASTHSPAAIALSQPDNATLLIQMSGVWKIGADLPKADEAIQLLISSPTIKHLKFDAQQVDDWDSSLLTFLVKIITHCQSNKIETDQQGQRVA